MIRSVHDRPGTVRSFLELLKGRILGSSVAHEETIAAKPPRLVQRLDHLPAEVDLIRAAAGVRHLYTHQVDAIEKALAGRNVVVATPTASGKTLIYNTPVISSLLQNPDGHALYVYPLKALEQDQLAGLDDLIANLGVPLTAAVYDGDTTTHNRKKIRNAPPQILLTTPDMLHASILAFHEQWAGFLAKLRYAVVDELHAYSGIFGSHVLHSFDASTAFALCTELTPSSSPDRPRSETRSLWRANF